MTEEEQPLLIRDLETRKNSAGISLLSHGTAGTRAAKIQKVIIFENKMNFVMAPYEEGTLDLIPWISGTESLPDFT